MSRASRTRDSGPHTVSGQLGEWVTGTTDAVSRTAVWLSRSLPRPSRSGAMALWKNLSTFALNLLWITIVVAIAAVLIDALARRTTEIAPIDVPKALVERGYSPEVAGRRLRDGMNRYIDAALTETDMRNPIISMRGEIPDIVVPTVGISIGTIASSIRSFFGGGRRRVISGEVTVADDVLWLRLRLDGREFHRSPKGIAPADVDALFEAAILSILEVTEPYLAMWAVWEYKKDAEKALEMATRIIARMPESDENVVRAYNLQGIILLNREQYPEAKNALETAIKLDGRWANPHANLGYVLQQQGKRDQAIAAVGKAIELEPKIGHVTRGHFLVMDRKSSDAIDEYRKAAKLDPKSLMALYGLGHALQGAGKPEEAIVEYRNAVALNPRHAYSYSLVARLLGKQDKLELAITEYRRAIELDSMHPEFPYGLSTVLRRAGKLDEAEAECRKAIALSPKYAPARVAFGDILRDQGKRDEAIVEYRRAIELDPRDKSVQNSLDQLLREGSR
jgi:tetratricopeptide (TPR) repeat protein